jgi:hypothetical protein
VNRPPVRLITDNLAERNFLQALYLDEIGSGRIALNYGLGAESAITMAESSLLSRPAYPVALVLNSETVDPEQIKARRFRIEKKLMVAASAESSWVVSLAIPKLNAWLIADPFIQEAFARRPDTRESYHSQAVAILDLVRRHPVDRQKVKDCFPDFTQLDDFLIEHTVAPASSA